MSIHLSEEEQLENLKNWWKSYGKTVVATVVVSVVAYFGYTAWKDQQRAKAEQASVNYEQLVKLANPEAGKAVSETDRATITHLASELKKYDSKSLYAHSAAFFLAKFAVADDKLDQAVTELKWILSAKPDAATEQLARLRLARVFTAQKAYSDALAQLSTEPATAFAAEYAEARGDIYKLQGDLDAARTAYEKALAATESTQQERYMLLQMKVDDLKLVEPVAATLEEKTQ